MYVYLKNCPGDKEYSEFSHIKQGIRYPTIMQGGVHNYGASRLKTRSRCNQPGISIADSHAIKKERWLSPGNYSRYHPRAGESRASTSPASAVNTDQKIFRTCSFFQNAITMISVSAFVA